jgi:hypothetical protein
VESHPSRLTYCTRTAPQSGMEDVLKPQCMSVEDEAMEVLIFELSVAVAYHPTP